MNNHMILTATPLEFATAYVSYALYDPTTARMIYVGYCEASKVFALPDARVKDAFDTLCPPDVPVMIRVIGWHKDGLTAYVSARKTIKNQMIVPPLNRSRSSTRGVGVRCITTGETWGSARECVDAHDISQSALSNHLNGKAGAKTVKGRKYERVSNG